MNSRPLFPHTVALETLNTCNARRIFCPLFQGEHQLDRKVRPAKILDQDLFEKYLQEILTWEQRPKTLFLNMDGEPLQDPLFIERIDALKRYGLSDIMTLQTNGQLLDERKAEAILAADFSNVVFGFDGATKEVYEAHRVRCSYDRVLQNIKMFVSMRNQTAKPLPIHIKFVRTKLNAHEVRKAYELFNDFMDASLDIFWDSLAIDWGGGENEKSEDSIFYHPRIASCAPAQGCSSMIEHLIVTVNDAIPACCFDYNFDISDGGYKIGERTLLETWRCQAKEDLRLRLLSDDPMIKPPKCRKCPALFRYTTANRPAPEVPEAVTSEGDLGFSYRFGARAEGEDEKVLKRDKTPSGAG